MFEKALRAKLRFSVPTIGIVSTEDLWDIDLKRLDTLAKTLNKKIKEETEESFIQDNTKANKELLLSFDIVKHIISVKLEEDKKRKEAQERKAYKQKLLAVIEAKKNESLETKSLDDLLKELDSLD